MFLGLSFIDFPRPQSLSQSILYRIKFVHHGFTERFIFEERVLRRGQGCCGTLNMCLGAFFFPCIHTYFLSCHSVLRNLLPFSDS